MGRVNSLLQCFQLDKERKTLFRKWMQSRVGAIPRLTFNTPSYDFYVQNSTEKVHFQSTEEKMVQIMILKGAGTKMH